MFKKESKSSVAFSARVREKQQEALDRYHVEVRLLTRRWWVFLIISLQGGSLEVPLVQSTTEHNAQKQREAIVKSLLDYQVLLVMAEMEREHEGAKKKAD